MRDSFHGEVGEICVKGASKMVGKPKPVKSLGVR